MKILQVNVMFQRGSTGKIVNDIHNVLQEKGIESVFGNKYQMVPVEGTYYLVYEKELKED